MRVGVPSEHGSIERRVALTPDAVGRLQPLGVEVLVQAGAGDAAALPDTDYEAAGARIVADGKALLEESDLIVMVTRPRATMRLLSAERLTISPLRPANVRPSEAVRRSNAASIQRYGRCMPPRRADRAFPDPPC